MNDVDIKALPDDVATLKALILNQATELRYLQEQLNNWGRNNWGRSKNSWRRGWDSPTLGLKPRISWLQLVYAYK